MIFGRRADMKHEFGNRRFWSTGYYVPAVGLNEGDGREDVREQEAADMALDRLSVKKYEDPFSRGQKKRG